MDSEVSLSASVTFYSSQSMQYSNKFWSIKFLDKIRCGSILGAWKIYLWLCGSNSLKMKRKAYVISASWILQNDQRINIKKNNKKTHLTARKSQEKFMASRFLLHNISHIVQTLPYEVCFSLRFRRRFPRNVPYRLLWKKVSVHNFLKVNFILSTMKQIKLTQTWHIKQWPALKIKYFAKFVAMQDGLWEEVRKYSKYIKHICSQNWKKR